MRKFLLAAVPCVLVGIIVGRLTAPAAVREHPRDIFEGEFTVVRIDHEPGDCSQRQTFFSRAKASLVTRDSVSVAYEPSFDGPTVLLKFDDGRVVVSARVISD